MPTAIAEKTPAPFVELRGVSKWFGVPNTQGGFLALDNVSLSVERGEFITVIGPSGCGKSTLIECLAGLTQPSSGEILVGGKPVTAPGPERVMVFQQASLLPWRDVMANVSYGAELARWDRTRIEERARRAIGLVGLTGFEHHFPHQLSGGMRQRVNLARALVMEASVILMDEPFGALDSMTKRAMQDELLSLHAKLSKTVIFITHDLDEAVYLADRMIVMRARPGGINSIRTIPFARPRARTLVDDPQFREIARSADAELASLRGKPAHA